MLSLLTAHASPDAARSKRSPVPCVEAKDPIGFGDNVPALAVTLSDDFRRNEHGKAAAHDPCQPLGDWCEGIQDLGTEIGDVGYVASHECHSMHFGGRRK